MPGNTLIPDEDAFDSEVAAFGDLEETDGLGEIPPIAVPMSLHLASDVCGERLDKVISRLLPQYSRSRLQQWIEAGHVTVDGQPAKTRMTMLGGEQIAIVPQAMPEQQAYAPEPITLNIVHEDASLLVIDKPAGMVVHPAAGNWSGTLLNGLLHHDPSLAGVPRAGIVHRLDKDTSGLMVVAKTLEAQTALVRQLQARTVSREYLALVWGTSPMSGTVNAAIGRHPRDRIKMAVSSHASAREAVTYYVRLATGTIDRHALSLVRCRLETGRTHQIRVHLQSIGYSLVGDPVYGKAHLAMIFPRQALHAVRLGLIHPVTGAECGWTAPPPADLQALAARAGIDFSVADVKN